MNALTGFRPRRSFFANAGAVRAPNRRHNRIRSARDAASIITVNRAE